MSFTSLDFSFQFTGLNLQITFFWKGTWELSLHVWNGLYFALFFDLYLGLECCIQNPFLLEPYNFAPQSSSVLWDKRQG